MAADQHKGDNTQQEKKFGNGPGHCVRLHHLAQVATEATDFPLKPRV